MCIKTYWPHGHPNELEDHLANNCREVPELVHSFYLGVVSARDFGREDTFSSPENSNKKRKTQVDQRELTDWFESTNINSQKKASITRALVRAFICCGIPFSIIENPFFIEFLHEMRPGYEPPTSELLSGRLLNQETARINDKIKEIIKNSENLTLARGLKAVYWKTITTTAAQIWQNNGGDRRSCNRLLAQMRNYELRKSPYNQEFDSHLETPMSWWLTIKDKYDYLPALAIMVFSITPHS
ncbi:hypothetical protein RhiirA4_449830, partial [Rhizophagus irregularis]